MPKNKVKYGLKNVHYAPVVFDENGYPTFSTPRRIPGAVNLSLDKEGDPTQFYADDSEYFTVNNNNGYSGDLEIALVPEQFKQEILSEIKDTNGVLLEDAESASVHFALLFEFTGDKKAIRHVLYNCTVTRPKIEGQTREESTEVKTDTLSLSSKPCKFLVSGKDVMIPKASSGDDVSDATYNNWYNAVYVANTMSSSVKISGESTVEVNETITLTAATVPAAASVVWSSNNEDVATVTSGGVVEGVLAGKATIMATLATDGSIFDTKVVTVTGI